MTKVILAKEGVFYTIQGEGIRTGVPSVFIRTSTCNLRCVWKSPSGTESKCDTPYTSYAPERNVKSVEEIDTEVQKHKGDIVLTGGEPFLQPEAIKYALSLSNQRYVTIETNGTMPPGSYLPDVKYPEHVLFSVSPKLLSAGSKPDFVKTTQEVCSRIIQLQEQYGFSVQFKFVIDQPSTMDEVIAFMEQAKISWADVVLMPEGTTSHAVAAKSLMVVDYCLKYGCRFSDRLHMHLWNGVSGK